MLKFNIRTYGDKLSAAKAWKLLRDAGEVLRRQPGYARQISKIRPAFRGAFQTARRLRILKGLTSRQSKRVLANIGPKMVSKIPDFWKAIK